MAAPASEMAPAHQEAAPGPIYVDTQHEDLVHDAQLDYYGCKLATSSSGAFSPSLMLFHHLFPLSNSLIF
jgi:hypothetical protein